MKVITAPLYYHEKYWCPSLFLAGGISNCPDWQKQFINIFKEYGRENENLIIFNPRRKDFDTSKKEESAKQIWWEFQHIRKSDIVLFWFPKETLCPITLFELGAALERKQKVFIGCDDEYQRKFDVQYQASLMSPEILVYPDMYLLYNAVVKELKFT